MQANTDKKASYRLAFFINMQRRVHMTFIENIYTYLKTNQITNNSEDFSTRFLKRSARYYSPLKARGYDVNADTLWILLEQLESNRLILEQYCDKQLFQTRIQKWHSIQQKVADELVKRAFMSKPVSKTAFNHVKNALQSVEYTNRVA